MNRSIAKFAGFAAASYIVSLFYAEAIHRPLLYTAVERNNLNETIFMKLKEMAKEEMKN